MKFQIGSSLKVKEGLVEGRYYNGMNGVYFNPDMEKYCGMEANVVEIENDKYKLDIDDGDWSWNNAMVEEVIDFEVGNFVKVTDGEYLGVIQNIIPDDNGNKMYSLDKNNVYLFSKDQLELINNN